MFPAKHVPPLGNRTRSFAEPRDKSPSQMLGAKVFGATPASTPWFLDSCILNIRVQHHKEVCDLKNTLCLQCLLFIFRVFLLPICPLHAVVLIWPVDPIVSDPLLHLFCCKGVVWSAAMPCQQSGVWITNSIQPQIAGLAKVLQAGKANSCLNNYLSLWESTSWPFQDKRTQYSNLPPVVSMSFQGIVPYSVGLHCR